MTIENGDDEKIPSSAGGCLCQDGPEETYILGYGGVFRFRRGEKRPGENVSRAGFQPSESLGTNSTSFVAPLILVFPRSG